MTIDGPEASAITQQPNQRRRNDPYAPEAGYHVAAVPIARDSRSDTWPVHCYGIIGVGRNLSPDAGTAPSFIP